MKRSMLLAGYTVHFSLSLLLTLKTHLYNTASSPRILTTSLYLLASFSFQTISSGLYYLTVFFLGLILQFMMKAKVMFILRISFIEKIDFGGLQTLQMPTEAWN